MPYQLTWSSLMVESSSSSVNCRQPVLALLGKTSFTLGDFITTTYGACRLHPQLARYIVATCRLPDTTVLDQARHLRTLLLADRTIPQPA